ncbi:hypothetical protein ABPG75_011006 [Micractinium tetrahymenae]
MASLDVGAARSRLAARESFFGGPLSTREQAKAPGWSAFVKAAPAPEKAAGKGSKGRSTGGSSKPVRAQPAPPPVDPEQERRQKLRQRRDYSGLDDDAPPPQPPPRQQQTAAGPRQQQQQAQQRGLASQLGQQQQQRVKVTTKRTAGGGGGRLATAARGMAMEVTALGKGRKQAASDALRQRVGEMVAQGRGGTPPAAVLGSPTGSGTAGGGGGAAAAAAAARAAREAAGAKAIMQNKPVRTATGMQTLQLVSRPLGQARGGAAGGGGGGALAAMRAGVAGSGGRGGAAAAGASPGSVTKAPWPVTGAGAPRRLQQQQQRAGGAGGRPQFRGAFYGGRQPPAALEARMHYNKRRLSLDGGEDLESFIASDEEGEGWASDGAAGEEDWRAALREATGGYDPSKFAHIDRLPDRDMEAAYDQIQAEERRALRIARTEDEREAEREALREAAKRERKRSKKGVHAFLDDGD